MGPQLDLCYFIGFYVGLLSKYACFGVGFVGTLRGQIFNEDEATWQGWNSDIGDNMMEMGCVSFGYEREQGKGTFKREN